MSERMKIFDEVLTPKGNKGIIVMFGGYPERIAYVDVQPESEDGFEFFQWYDGIMMDIVVKPLNIYPIRVLKFIRHSKNNNAVIEVGKLRLDKSKLRVSYDGKDVKLPQIEFDILALLAQRPDRLVPRERIIEEIWQGHLTDAKTLNVHICKLRKKIPTIETISGSGYKLAE